MAWQQCKLGQCMIPAGAPQRCTPFSPVRLALSGQHSCPLLSQWRTQSSARALLRLRRPCRHLRRGRRRQSAPNALDAPMPFDFEQKAKDLMAKQRQLKVGIVGFGKFGQFLAQRLVQAGHQVLATSRGDYSALAAGMGVKYFGDANDFCEEHPDVVVFATSILSLEGVVSALPVQRLRRSTLFVDVLSVKAFPKRLMLSLLPPEVDILCTHPMFGPDSGAGSWQGLNLMFERVRVGPQPARQQRAARFLQFFEAEGCKMVEMACEDHDRIAASTQFITHTVGRVLGDMALAPTRIDTRGFQSLLSLVDNTTHDSFDLYYGLFMYNENATEELERLERAFDSVKRQLLGRLHDVARAQLFQQAPEVAPPPPAPPPQQQQQQLMLGPPEERAASGNGSIGGAHRGSYGAAAQAAAELH